MSDKLGPIEIEFVLDKQADEQAKKLKTSLDGVGMSAKKGGEDLKQAIKEQKDLIKSLEIDVKNLQKAYDKAGPGQLKSNAGAEVGSAKRALTEEKARLADLQKQENAENERANSIFGKLGTTIRNYVGGLLTLVAAKKIFQAAIASSNSLTERFHEAMAGASGAVQAFFQSLYSNDTGNFINNMKKGAKAARDFAEATNEYKRAMQAHGVVVALEEKDVVGLEAIFRNRSLGYEAQIKAIEDYMTKRKDQAATQLDIEQDLNNKLLESIKGKSGLESITDEQIKIFATVLEKNEDILVRAKEFRTKMYGNTAYSGRGKSEEILTTDYSKLQGPAKDLVDSFSKLIPVGITINDIMAASLLNDKLRTKEVDNLSESYTRLGKTMAIPAEIDANLARQFGFIINKGKKEFEGVEGSILRLQAELKDLETQYTSTGDPIRRSMLIKEIEAKQAQLDSMDPGKQEQIRKQAEEDRKLKNRLTKQEELLDKALENRNQKEIDAISKRIVLLKDEHALRERLASEALQAAAIEGLPQLQKVPGLGYVPGSVLSEKYKKVMSGIGLKETLINGLDSKDIDRLYQRAIDSLQEFEGKRLSITKHYGDLILAARLRGDEQTARKLEGQRDVELLKETEDYQNLFEDIGAISIATIERTRNFLLEQFKILRDAEQITEEQYQKLITSINKQADSGYKGRGMEALFGGGKTGGIMTMMFGEGDFESKISSVTKMFSSGSTATGAMADNTGKAAGNMGGVASKAAGAISIIDAIVKAIDQTLIAVCNTLQDIADLQESMGNSDSANSLKETAGAISIINQGASGGWDSLKNGDSMSSISQLVGIFIKMGTYQNEQFDAKVEVRINAQANAINNLSYAYDRLSKSMESALGEQKYTVLKTSILLLRTEAALYEDMIATELTKNNPDRAKLTQWEKEKQATLDRMDELINNTKESLLGGSVKDVADDLGKALLEAFAKGEGAAAAWGEKVDEVIGNIVKRLLVQKLFEEPFGNLLDSFLNEAVDKNGNVDMNLLLTKMPELAEMLKQAFALYPQIIDSLPPGLKEILTGTTTTGSPQDLSGAIKGVSEETASVLAGQVNAIRISQAETNGVIRQQLIHLAEIASNTRYLISIDSKMDEIKSSSLRSQGLN